MHKPSDSHYSDLRRRSMEVTVVFTLSASASAFAPSSLMPLTAGRARARVRHDASCGNMCAAMCACAVSTGHCSMLPRELSKPPCRKHRRLRQPRHTCIQRCEAVSGQIRRPTTPPTTTLTRAPHNRRPCVHATHADQHCIHASRNRLHQRFKMPQANQYHTARV